MTITESINPEGMILHYINFIKRGVETFFKAIGQFAQVLVLQKNVCCYSQTP